MAKKIKRYITVSAATKKEIRGWYELGVDLKILAHEYGVNLGTLTNLASKNGWEKGINAELIHNQALEKVKEKYSATSEEQIDMWMTLQIAATKEMYRELLTGGAILSKAREEAISLRIKSLTLLRENQKDMFNLRNETEEIEHRRATVQYERDKLELERLYETKEKESKDIDLG